jgi:TolB-like protein
MYARFAVALLASLVVHVGGGVGSIGLGGFVGAAASAAPRPPTLAVLYFDYDGSDAELGFLRKGLQQLLVTDLVGVAAVTVVERARLEEVLAELKLNRSTAIDRKAAVQVGKLLGARYLVLGSYFVFKNDLNVSATVVDVETGVVLGGARDHRQVEEFGALEQQLATRLADVLRDKVVAPTSAPAKRAGPRRKPRDAGKPPPGAAAQATATEASAPPSARKPTRVHARTAARYGQGLDALDHGDKAAARAAFEAVLKEQPDFSAASVDLARLAQ